MSLEGLTEGQIKQLATGMQTLLSSQDGEVRKGAQRLLKKIDPKLSFPELEVDDLLEARLKPLTEDNQKLRDQLKERDFNTEIQNQHAKVVARGFKVDDVQKFMKERGIVNFDTAMTVMDMEQRLAAPTPEALSTAGTYDLPDDAKDIFKNPAQWARKTAHTLIDQLKARKTA